MHPEDQAQAALSKMFALAKAQFGSAVKSQWFYVDNGCPGCGRAVGAMKFKGEDTLSLNAFIYRPRCVDRLPVVRALRQAGAGRGPTQARRPNAAARHDRADAHQGLSALHHLAGCLIW